MKRITTALSRQLRPHLHRFFPPTSEYLNTPPNKKMTEIATMAAVQTIETIAMTPQEISEARKAAVEASEARKTCDY